MTRNLDTHDVAILQALQELGSDWHDRNEIAARLGKSELSEMDKFALTLLSRDGHIEAGRKHSGRRGSSRTAYRIAQNGGGNG